MKKIICIVLVLLLTACSPSVQETEFVADSDGDYTHGIYALSFSVKRQSGWPFGDWEFIYMCNGETVTDGYRIVQSLTVFPFFPFR